ncbi:hypothetical protein POPTR_019G076450v4 [Populus trichocarpa]|uniref:Uncharacterized protein n=1 Tax=Populus trichocarpa TaxID=3694 RepID=A0ACC0RKX4_POPTR|nr:hypothetical protein POPTR_019G076450v4 [Populus trichocarpa]
MLISRSSHKSPQGNHVWLFFCHHKQKDNSCLKMKLLSKAGAADPLSGFTSLDCGTSTISEANDPPSKRQRPSKLDRD